MFFTRHLCDELVWLVGEGSSVTETTGANINNQFFNREDGDHSHAIQFVPEHRQK